MDLSRIVPLFVVIVFTRLVASPGADGSEALDLPPAPLHYVIAGQTTVVWQYHPAFRSPYEGPRSLDHRPEDAVSHSYTLYTGVTWPRK